MELPDLRLTLLMFLLALSAFFAGSETAIFSFGRIGLGELKREKNPKTSFLQYLLDRPMQLLMTILLGNEVVNVSISAIVASVCSDIFGFSGWKTGILVSILVTTPMLLFIGEITPKVIALRSPRIVTLLVVRPIYYFMKFISPFRKIAVENNDNFNSINEKVFLGMVDASHEEEVIDNEEREVIHNIFKFSDKTLNSIMVPRDKTFFFHESSTLDQIIDGVKNTGFSRIPVLEDNGFKVVGILMAKKLLSYLDIAGENKISNFQLSKVIEPAQSFAANAKLDHVLKILKSEQQHMGVVVDQYGQLIGVVTFEDLLEELFGEIYDERDVQQ